MAERHVKPVREDSQETRTEETYDGGDCESLISIVNVDKRVEHRWRQHPRGEKSQVIATE